MGEGLEISRSTTGIGGLPCIERVHGTAVPGADPLPLTDIIYICLYNDVGRIYAYLYVFIYAGIESASLVLYFRSHQVVQAYANTYATAVVYARCFIQELNKSAELYKDVTWPLGRGEDLLTQGFRGSGLSPCRGERPPVGSGASVDGGAQHSLETVQS